MTQAIKTCLSATCPERFSMCCGARAIRQETLKGARFVCGNCSETFVGRKCTAGETMKSKCCHADMQTITGDEGTSYWSCIKCGNPADPQSINSLKSTKRSGKSFFDYSLKEKKEIVDKAARESNRMQREMMAKTSTSPTEEWEEEFRKLAYPIVHSNTFPEKDGRYLDELVDFIRSLLSQAYEEGIQRAKRMAIEYGIDRRFINELGALKRKEKV